MEKSLDSRFVPMDQSLFLYSPQPHSIHASKSEQRAFDEGDMTPIPSFLWYATYFAGPIEPVKMALSSHSVSTSMVWLIPNLVTKKE